MFTTVLPYISVCCFRQCATVLEPGKESQPTFTCSKLAIETLEQGVK